MGCVFQGALAYAAQGSQTLVHAAFCMVFYASVGIAQVLRVALGQIACQREAFRVER